MRNNTHELKVLPEFYQAIIHNLKTFEIRKDDRDYKVGDVLYLKEYNPEIKEYTGNLCKKEITYILRDCEEYGLMKGYCILGIKPYKSNSVNINGNVGVYIDHVEKLVL